jgi:hypothetical protein
MWMMSMMLAGGSVGVSPLPEFVDITEEAGITFKHSYGDHNMSNIVEGTGPGCVVFDYDIDGDPDLYFFNACWLREVNDNLGRDLRGKLFNALYRNNGDGSFADVTQQAGVGDDGYGMGGSAADFDGDGDLDLYVCNYGPNVFYRNNGDGTFTDVSKKAGLDDKHWSVSAPWLDYDNDGDLDVFVANYLEYDAGEFRDFYPAAGYPGPLSYKGQADRLYRNNGDGTFTEVTKPAGVFFPDGRAMSAVACNLNDDGYLDIYVANDAMPNNFYVNTGRGTFVDRAVEVSAAFGEGGQGASSMGPAVGDVDRDGRMDLYIPDMGYGCLLMNRGEMFVDMTAPTGLALICGQYTGWGGLLLDYDNDGWLDVYLSTGNAHHEYTEEDVLARNAGDGKFIDVARHSGSYFHNKYVGRGSAMADFDNDGDMDLVVMNLNGRARLLRNDGGNRNNWLMVAPKLGMNKADAIGARVTVTVGGRKLVQDAISVTGYLSQSDGRTHFGLGQADRVEEVEIRWPNRQTTTLRSIPVNTFLTVHPTGK